MYSLQLVTRFEARSSTLYGFHLRRHMYFHADFGQMFGQIP